MNMATKNCIFQRYLEEYLKADKHHKGEILDHVCDVIKIHRKAAIRRFCVLQMKDSTLVEVRGRPVFYTPDVTVALKDLWDTASEPCGENLYGVIPEYVAILERDKMWKHNPETTQKLLSMSQGTVKKRVAHFTRRQFSSSHGKSTTTPGSTMSVIPIRMDGWRESGVGTMQLDTVAHCGGSVAGDFIYTVNATDTTTLWGQRRAQWNKGKIATVDNMKYIDNILPFPVIEWHPDSGSEFINWHCYNIYKDKLTRSRPNHKNDNCFVEERNGHIIRRWVGYERLDDIKLVKALNSLYDILDHYLNHFVANKRIVSKKRVGARWVITREKTAKTPYERLLQKDDISQETKDKIQQEHDKLNPAILKQEIDKLRKQLFNILKTTRTI